MKELNRFKGFLITLTFLIWIFTAVSGCDDSKSCVNCGGGLIDGYLYKTVSAADIASIPDLKIETCIRFKYLALSDDEIDPESVETVDDCCCKEYEFEL